MSQIKNIIFDLGGVIINLDINKTIQEFNKLSNKQFETIYTQLQQSPVFDKFDKGEISESDFFNEIQKALGINIPKEKLLFAWNAMLLTFREKSLQFLDVLKPKYKLFLLSNTNHIHMKEFKKIYLEKKREIPFEEFFDKVYFSCEIGLRKPNAECYDLVLKENELVPGKTLFVDDSFQNVEAAKLTGMQTVLLQPGKYIEGLDL